MRRWALVAKLTKSLECKHEQLVTWRSSVYQSREVESEQSDRFSRNCTSSKESRRIRRSVGCHVVSHKCHFGTDTNTHNRFQTPPLFVTVSRIPLSLTDPIVCNFEQFSLTVRSNCVQLLYNSAHFWKSRLLTASARSQIWQIYPKRSGARAIKTSQSRIECRWWCRLRERSSVGIREPKTSWRSFMTVAGNERG